MSPSILQNHLTIALEAAKKAGEAILSIYETGDFGVEAKADNSPLTLADKKAHEEIIALLQTTPFPILSEEGAPIAFAERKQWETFWMVDPLDGTKEFIKRNGEFTVNIALIGNGVPVLGVVYVPVRHTMYYSTQGAGAYKMEGEQAAKRIQVAKSEGETMRIVASRSHLNKETQAFVNQYPKAELVNMGSSLKLVLVAEGKADLYPRFAPTMEWDTAAAHAIVLEAGGEVIQQPEGVPLLYNKEQLLNPWFLVRATLNA